MCESNLLWSVQALVRQDELTGLGRSMKRKLDWHADQLAFERKKVTVLQRALQASEQHIVQLHHTLARLKQCHSYPEFGSSIMQYDTEESWDARDGTDC